MNDIKMMKAIQVHQYGGLQELKLEQIPYPQPATGEVLVRMRASGILPIDWKIRQGLFKKMYPMQFPYMPGRALSGIIAKVGPGVTAFSEGQAVFGRTSKGTYGEYTTAPVDGLALIPSSISFEEAATLQGGATTAWQSLIHDGKLQAGQRVLIHGAAGGVGLFAVQIAKWKGAEVIGTASTANIEFLYAIGVTQAIDYTTTRFEQHIKEVDLVLDTIGGETLERSWPIIKQGGTLISLVAQPSLEKAGKLSIKALQPSSLPSAEDLKAIAQLLQTGSLKAVISKTFPLHEASIAHALSQSGHGRGRIILQIPD